MVFILDKLVYISITYHFEFVQLFWISHEWFPNAIFHILKHLNILMPSTVAALFHQFLLLLRLSNGPKLSCVKKLYWYLMSPQKHRDKKYGHRLLTLPFLHFAPIIEIKNIKKHEFYYITKCSWNVLTILIYLFAKSEKRIKREQSRMFLICLQTICV